MKASIFWFLPTQGDGRYLGSEQDGRTINLAYLTQVAQAAESFGFSGALIPTGRFCEDSWIVASSLISATRHFRFLVALRPGVVLPTFAARQAATLDRLSGGRVLFNLVAGGDEGDLRADGITLSHDERYKQAIEFVEIYNALMQGKTINRFRGKYYEINDAKLGFLPLQLPRPPLFFGGSSPIAHELAGKYVDKYLSWGEPPQQVKEKIDNVRAIAQKYGREVSFGVRFQIIVRESKEEAWSAANKLISKLDKATIADATQHLKGFDSVGQQRMNALYASAPQNLEVYPNVWAGVGLVRGGAGTALVGDAQSILQTMQEYVDIGVDTFVLSGYPNLEEAYYVGELLLPHIEQPHVATKLRKLAKRIDSIANRA